MSETHPLNPDVGRAMMAFVDSPKACRLLRDVTTGRREFVATELFVGTVLDYLGEDPRAWRDWREPVFEAAGHVLAERRGGREA